MEEIIAVINTFGVVTGRVNPNIDVLVEHGYLVADKKKLVLTPAQAESLRQSDSKIDTAQFLDAPVVALLLRRDAAIATWQEVAPELDDTYSSPDLYSALRDRYAFFPPVPVLERTLVLIKPGYTPEQYTAVMDTLEKNDFVVLGKMVKVLPKEQVVQLLGQENKEEVEYITSEPSIVLAVERLGAVDAWRLLQGPEDPSLAKTIAPTSVRAVLAGQDTVHNGVHSSPTADKAREDLELLFPAPFPLERTLALVKPDAYPHLDAVRDVIKANGFTITASEDVTMSVERAEQLYAAHRDSPFFDNLTRYMASGPSHAFLLTKPAAIDHWRKLIGPSDIEAAKSTKPESLRARFATDDVRNGFHGSDNSFAAREEIDQYFPKLPVETVPKFPEVQEFLLKKPAPRPFSDGKKSLQDILMEGLVQLCRVKPQGKEAVLWLSDWLLRNNANQPVVDHPEEPEAAPATSVNALKAQVPPKIYWIVGGPGTGRANLASRLALQHGFETISCAELCRAAVQSGTPVGSAIKSCQSKSRPVPPHLIAQLVSQAIAATTSKREQAAESKKSAEERKQPVRKDKLQAIRFLLVDFPYSLDQAFEFEKTGVVPDRVLYLDGASDTLVRRGLEEKDAAGETRETMTRRIVTFREDVAPLVEHYQVFKKAQSVSVDGPDDVVFARLASSVQA